MKYIVIKTVKRYAEDEYTFQSCFQVIGDPCGSIQEAKDAKMLAEAMYPTGEKFIIIQIFE